MNLRSYLLPMLVVLGGTSSHAQEVGVEYSQESGTDVASVEVFDDALAPYGEWLYVGNYGRVWRPRVSLVGLDFQPYATGGHWVYTDYGWTFVSDFDWGWAPFHYGRWALDTEFGWVWSPDNVWGPAWVDWRFGGGFIGWAPLPPLVAGFAIDTYYPAWCFVSAGHFIDRDFYHHRLPIDHYHRAFGATAPIHHQMAYGGTRWPVGPRPGEVSQAAGRPIQSVPVTPPRPGVIQPVRVGTPGVPVVPPSARPAHPLPGTPGVPLASPGTRPAHSPWVSPAPSVPRTGTPLSGGRPGPGSPQLPYGGSRTFAVPPSRPSNLGAPHGTAPQLATPVWRGAPSSATTGERLQNGWAARAAPSVRPVGPPMGVLPRTPAPHFGAPTAPSFHPPPSVPSASRVSPSSPMGSSGRASPQYPSAHGPAPVYSAPSSARIAPPSGVQVHSAPIAPHSSAPASPRAGGAPAISSHAPSISGHGVRR